jgi:capsular polysaccharide export protein
MLARLVDHATPMRYAPPTVGASGGPCVVILDERESADDPFGQSAHERHVAFRRMLESAQSEYPNTLLWLMRSADPGRGAWLSSYLDTLPPCVVVAPHECDAPAAAIGARAVYTLGASEGLLALLAGAAVHVFGTPYYAGWGLTTDDRPLGCRHARPTREALFEAVFDGVVRYLDPLTGQAGTLDGVVEGLALQRAVATRFADLGAVAAVGVQHWKRRFVAPYLRAAGGRLRWVADSAHVAADERTAQWGAGALSGRSVNAVHVRMEDGFLHSCGLGSDLSAPYSCVLDRQGIYFDATGPNDLITLLNEAAFDATELQRAAVLRQRIVEAGLTKYNLGRRTPTWKAPAGALIVLVPGQVADDASVRLGSAAITTAEALLAQVRRVRPDAWLVYRPHPDVLSGNRGGLAHAAPGVDVVDTTSDIVSLIECADEVHTLTSLVGFDALLRGKAVFTYGKPFYAGWGLTHDAVAAVPGRRRRLSLDMLTAGTLLRYPLYWDWQLQCFTTPEAVVNRLAPAAARPLRAVRPSPGRLALKTWRWLRNVAGIHLFSSRARSELLASRWPTYRR